MKVREICKGHVVTIRGSEDLTGAANRMRERHVGYLIVVEPMAPDEETGQSRERPIGVLTDRDIVVSVLARGADPRLLKVEDVMTRRAVTVYEDEMVGDALARMRSIGVRRLPVISPQGALVGVLSLDDVLDSVADELQDVVGSIRKEQRVECAVRP